MENLNTFIIVLIVLLIIVIYMIKLNVNKIEKDVQPVSYNCDIYIKKDNKLYVKHITTHLHYLDNLIPLMENSEYAIEDETIVYFNRQYYIYLRETIHKHKWFPCNVVLLGDSIKFISIQPLI